jgi:hypothetical protein
MRDLLSIRILLQRINQAVQHVLHSGLLDGVVAADIVLVYLHIAMLHSNPASACGKLLTNSL